MEGLRQGKEGSIQTEDPCSAQSRQEEKISHQSLPLLSSDKGNNESLGVGEKEIHKAVRQVCPEEREQETQGTKAKEGGLWGFFN